MKANTKKNLISVELETCHANDDGSAFYAYFRSEPTDSDWQDAVDNSDGHPLELVEPSSFEDREEVKNRLSKAGGWRRYFLGAAG